LPALHPEWQLERGLSRGKVTESGAIGPTTHRCRALGRRRRWGRRAGWRRRASLDHTRRRGQSVAVPHPGRIALDSGAITVEPDQVEVVPLAQREPGIFREARGGGEGRGLGPTLPDRLGL